MTTTTRNRPQDLTGRQQKGRAINAVAELLRKKLSVPNIYIEPRFTNVAADVLAVDRAGAGDLHGVKIVLDLSGPAPKHVRALISETRQELMSLPTHYKYLGINAAPGRFEAVARDLTGDLYAADGIGRIGLIAVTYRGDEPPVAEIVIAPERFRVDPERLRNIEKKYLEKTRPDIEVRI